MRKVRTAAAVLVLGLYSARSRAEDATIPGEFKVDPPTLKCLGFRWHIKGDDNHNARCRVDYRKKGADAWMQALPLLRVHGETVNRDSGRYRCGNLFAGSILFLDPDTEYEAQLKLTDPDGGDVTKTVTVRTRAEPRTPPPLRTLHLYPPGAGGEKKTPAFTSLARAAASLRPGDLLLVHPGVHEGNVTIRVQGTPERPVVLRGTGGGEAIIQGRPGTKEEATFNLLVSGSSHLFIENLTLRGGEWAIRAEETRHLIVRRCKILDVSTGIRTYSEKSEYWYVADNVITGRNREWYPRERGCPSHTGINFYGRGHVICHNRIEKFWDCLAIANYGPPKKSRDLQCVAIDMYNNDLSEAVDDPLETDYGCHNVRVFNNRLGNGHTGISVQPFYGGPVYLVRNQIYGVTRLVFKLHNWPSGILMFHNTSVCTYQGFRSSETWQNAILRNNLLLGAVRYAMETGSPDPRTSLDYNGWRKTDDPGRFIKWHDGRTWASYPTLKAFAAATGHERHGVMVDFDAFERCPVPKEGVTYDLSMPDLRLRESSSAVDAGVVLPGINDGFTGKAPDLGCFERGLPLPHYGPRPEGSLVAGRPEPPARSGSVWALAVKKLRQGTPERTVESPRLMEARALAVKGDYEAAARLLESGAASVEEGGALASLAAGFRAAAELRRWIIDGVAEGRQESTFVDVMGIRLRGKVVAADEKGLTVEALGSESRARWSELSPSRLFSLARKYAREGREIPGEKLGVLRLFAAPCGLKAEP